MGLELTGEDFSEEPALQRAGGLEQHKECKDPRQEEPG